MIRPHSRSTFFPYTTLFRSGSRQIHFFLARCPSLRPCLRKVAGLFSPPGKNRRNHHAEQVSRRCHRPHGQDRKSTRLNSSHVAISYAVFCLKKKNKQKWLVN